MTSGAPQLKQLTEIVHLRATNDPLCRWAVDTRYLNTLMVVTVKNMMAPGTPTAADDLNVSLKFQDSDDSPATDHMCLLQIPEDSSNVSIDGESPDCIQFTEVCGAFNATFTDMSGGAIVNLRPGAEKTFTLNTKKGYVQVVATTANNAKALIIVKSTNVLSNSEGKVVRHDTSPPPPYTTGGAGGGPPVLP